MKTTPMIVINPYNPEWPKEFEVIRKALQDTLGNRVVQIDHIGSTSVPGLGAKDVIDIQITVQELSPKIIQKMVNAGYEHLGNITHDHVPLGEDGIQNCGRNLSSPSRRDSAVQRFMYAWRAIRINGMRCCSAIICVHIPTQPDRLN